MNKANTTLSQLMTQVDEDIKEEFKEKSSNPQLYNVTNRLQEYFDDEIVSVSCGDRFNITIKPAQEASGNYDYKYVKYPTLLELTAKRVKDKNKKRYYESSFVISHLEIDKDYTESKYAKMTIEELEFACIDKAQACDKNRVDNEKKELDDLEAFANSMGLTAGLMLKVLKYGGSRYEVEDNLNKLINR